MIARVIAWMDGNTFDDLGDGEQGAYLDAAQQCSEDLEGTA